MATNENLPPNVVKQIAKELKNLDQSPPEGIKVVLNGEDFSTIFADIEGPAGTPYDGGVFRMKLLLSNDFPNSPPKGYFQTKIFHPNIATTGEICVNTLKKDWNATLGLRHVLTVVRCLLIEPFPESALNEQAGKMLLEDYQEYARLARLYTGIHALKPKPKTPAISESTTALNVSQPKSTSTTQVPPASALSKPKLKNKTPAITESTTTVLNTCMDENTVPMTNQKIETVDAAGSIKTTTTKPSAAAVVTNKKKDGPVASKVQVEKKKIDARKKSLRRL